MTVNLDFKVTRYIDALGILCAQLTRDLFAIAKFLFSKTSKQTELHFCALAISVSARCRPTYVTWDFLKKILRYQQRMRFWLVLNPNRVVAYSTIRLVSSEYSILE